MITELQRQVARAVLDGEDLDAIESRIIDPASLDDDHKAALWLLAEGLEEWPRAARFAQRELVMDGE